MKHLFVFILLLSVLSCKRNTRIVENSSPQISSPVPEDDILPKDRFPAVDLQPGLERVPIFSIIELERTRCYGNCPVYHARIFSDGRAEFEGIANVPIIGKFRSTISTAMISKIYDLAEAANYFVLRIQYPGEGPKLLDLPTTITYLKRGGLEKRIQNHYDAPAKLRKYENQLEKLLLDLEWEKVNKK